LLLYLIRHAEAEIIGLGGVTRDFDRPLTAHGREQARALAQTLANRHVIIDAIAASPLVRAYQTAVEFLSVLAPNMRPTTCDHLAIEKLKPHHLSDFLAHLPPSGDRTPSRDEKAVVAVGHMPDLASYLEWLIGAASGTIHMSKAGIACVHFEDDPAKASGKLLWLVPPEWISPTGLV
jgi:phosphohistidine phosphatase